MRIRALNHCVYQVQYQLVWGTRYRRKVLKPYVKDTLIRSFYKTLRRFPSWYIHEINTDQDHVHLLIEVPPSYSIAEVVQHLKADSSQYLKKQFKFIREMCPDGHLWSVGYFVSTVGLNEQKIRKYIERQGNQDRGIDISNEFE